MKQLYQLFTRNVFTLELFMPENAQIFLAEDNEGHRRVLTDLLELHNHTVVAAVATREEALRTLEATLPAFNIAVLDGNLNAYSTSGKDGADIAKYIRAHFPDVKIIGYSAGSTPWADFDSHKNAVVLLQND